MNIEILDCTLRDGGYINNWQFTEKINNSIFDSLVSSKVEVIECGYLSFEKEIKQGTIYKNINEIESSLKNIQSRNTINLVVMINQGEVDVSKLPLCEDTKIDGIRLAFHKKNLEKSLEEAKIIKEKGYKVFFQPMVTKSYSEEEFLKLLNKTNELNPYAFYIVDSFGSIDKKDFLRFLSLSDHRLQRQIKLGFHGHNNMQYVFANAINLLENVSTRDILIDSSIFGMGRGAGNLNTEIIFDYLNKYYNKNYNIEPLLEVADNYIEYLYRENPWGFTPAQYFSAKYNCHPNYASYLTSMKKLSIKAINAILSQIQDLKKPSFDKDYIHNIYLEYNKKSVTLTPINLNMFENKKILIIGAGKSIYEKQNEIKKYIDEDTIVVNLNSSKEIIKTDFHFYTNQKRYDENIDLIQEDKLITASNIISHKNGKIVDYSKLLKTSYKDNENVLSLFLGLLRECNIKKIFLAGIDGYKLNKESKDNDNIQLTNLDFKEEENIKIKKVIEYFSEVFSIEFVTPTIFKSAIKLKILGVIPARYKSSRFEGKPLAKINGISMIKRTYLQANKSKLLDKLIVATDDKKIQSFCKEENIPVIMTSDNCLTGTDRIAEVSKELSYDLYVNIQGDEPVIDPSSIDEIVSEYKKHTDEYIAYNLYKKIDEKDEIESNTIIKTITNEKDELVYMSRLAIPFNKSDLKQEFKKQVCVYGFTKKALDMFSSRNKGINEIYEDIEILRFIDMGYKVKMKETTVDSIAVDIPSDIEKVEKFLEEKGLH